MDVTIALRQKDDLFFFFLNSLSSSRPGPGTLESCLVRFKLHLNESRQSVMSFFFFKLYAKMKPSEHESLKQYTFICNTDPNPKYRIKNPND